MAKCMVLGLGTPDILAAFHDELEHASDVVADLVAALDAPEDGDVNEPCVDGPDVPSCTCLCAVSLELAARACAAQLLASMQVCMVIAVGVFFFCWIPCSGVPLPGFQACMASCIKAGMKWVVGTCILPALLASANCLVAAWNAYRACLARC